jgi:hypothetical protein
VIYTGETLRVDPFRADTVRLMVNGAADNFYVDSPDGEMATEARGLDRPGDELSYGNDKIPVLRLAAYMTMINGGSNLLRSFDRADSGTAAGLDLMPSIGDGLEVDRTFTRVGLNAAMQRQLRVANTASLILIMTEPVENLAN